VNEWWVCLLARGIGGYCERMPNSDWLMLRLEGDEKETQRAVTMHSAEPSSARTRGKGWDSPDPGSIVHIPVAPWSEYPR